jgi:enoyl-CoA hydratase/carnithine racemase
MGLVNQVVDPGRLTEVVREYATILATSVSPGSLAATKQQVYEDLHRDVGTAVEVAGARLRTMMTEPNFAEGVAALVEKRPPRFT